MSSHFMPKGVGILGSGKVGQALGKGFVTAGYEVKIGSRSPEKLDTWVKEVGGKAYAGTFDQAASYGDIVVLATLGEATDKAIDLAGRKNFAGKLVIDATNPLDFSKGMPPGLLPDFNTSSLGEYVQQKLPDSRVVKCFNTVPNSLMFRPRFPGTGMLICGNDFEREGGHYWHFERIWLVGSNRHRRNRKCEMA
ncbi:MAG: NADPH-dependent F420 reductase [Nitrososphaerales archaeon]